MVYIRSTLVSRLSKRSPNENVFPRIKNLNCLYIILTKIHVLYRRTGYVDHFQKKFQWSPASFMIQRNFSFKYTKIAKNVTSETLKWNITNLLLYILKEFTSLFWGCSINQSSIIHLCKKP